MRNVEDVYPLSPMQEMMLFHACTRSGNDILFNQIYYQITGPLQPAAFQSAWQAVLERHSALRTAFLWEGLKRPQQVVRRQLQLPFECLDWRNLPVGEHERHFQNLKEADRAKAFKIEQAPLMRVTLIRVEEEAWWLIWSSHHLILDRWCIPVVIQDLASLYLHAIGERAELPHGGRSFKEYIGWIRRQEEAAAQVFWQRELSGLGGPATITSPFAGKSLVDAVSLGGRCELQGASFTALKTFCKKQRLTLATVVQAAWSLVLNRHTGSQDVCFGVVVSGRPVDVPDVEGIVGSFVNNVPVRVRLPANSEVVAWLQELQSVAHRRTPHEYISATQLQAWCDLPGASSLFDTIIVWLADAAAEDFAGLRMSGLSADMGTAYPLTISVEETANGLVFTAQLNPRFSSCQELDTLLKVLCTKLAELAGVERGWTLADLDLFRAALGTNMEDAQVAILDYQPPIPVFAEGQTAARLDASAREEVSLELIQEYVLAEWRQVLDREDIGLDQDFFDLGGDSLKAATLLSNIERCARKNIPMLALFRQATIRAMAQAIQSSDWPLKPETAFSIRSRGDLPVLFCVATPEVNTLGYFVLARYLDEDRPMVLLQAPPDGSAMRAIMPAELPALAKKYIEALRAVQAEGPYYLLGMCRGALLAAEIARQLEKSGESISFFGAIDTWALYTISRRYHLHRLGMRYEYYRDRLRELIVLKPALRREAIRGLLVSKLPQTLRTRLASFEFAAAGTVSSSVEARAPDEQATEIVDRVYWSADMPDTVRLSGTATVFRARTDPQQSWRIKDPSMGWSKHARNVRLIRLPIDDHHQILREPQVAIMAAELSKCLKGEVTSEQ